MCHLNVIFKDKMGVFIWQYRSLGISNQLEKAMLPWMFFSCLSNDGYVCCNAIILPNGQTVLIENGPDKLNTIDMSTVRTQGALRTQPTPLVKLPSFSCSFRIYSSSMRTVRNSSRLLGGSPLGGGGCLLQGCLLLGGVCSGGCLLWGGGVPAPGSACSWGVCSQGVCFWEGGCGGIPACTEADPPVDRQTGVKT